MLGADGKPKKAQTITHYCSHTNFADKAGEFVIQTDASGYGKGAVLSLKWYSSINSGSNQ